MDKKVRIEMTYEQQTWMLRFLNREWYEELNHQYNSREIDTTYLEDMLEVYEACLGKPTNSFHALANKGDIENKKNEIENLKRENL